MAEPADLDRERAASSSCAGASSRRPSSCSSERGVAATKVSDICDARRRRAQDLLQPLPVEAGPGARDRASTRSTSCSSRSRRRASRAAPPPSGSRASSAAWPSAALEAGPMFREVVTELVHVVHESGTELRAGAPAARRLRRDRARRPRGRRRHAPPRRRDAHRDDPGRVLRADLQLREPRRLPARRTGARRWRASSRTRSRRTPGGVDMARREDEHDPLPDPERLVRRRVEPRAARGRRAARSTTSARSWCCSARARARRACSTRSARTSARTSATAAA